jgi:hypothetical protein
MQVSPRKLREAMQMEFARRGSLAGVPLPS